MLRRKNATKKLQPGNSMKLEGEADGVQWAGGGGSLASTALPLGIPRGAVPGPSWLAPGVPWPAGRSARVHGQRPLRGNVTLCRLPASHAGRQGGVGRAPGAGRGLRALDAGSDRGSGPRKQRTLESHLISESGPQRPPCGAHRKTKRDHPWPSTQ